MVAEPLLRRARRSLAGTAMTEWPTTENHGVDRRTQSIRGRGARTITAD